MYLVHQKNLNDQSAQVIAEQITLMDLKIFKDIQKRECLGQAWKWRDCRSKAPNILAMTDQFNRVSKFVQVFILMAPENTGILVQYVHLIVH